MKEYAVERGIPVDIRRLRAGHISDEDFRNCHRDTVILTHDVAIDYQGGIILLERDNDPERGELWPVGGRLKKGVPIEESLRQKARGECGLELKDLRHIGERRCYFTTDPLGHGKGTDTFGLMFYAKGMGEVKLDNLHSSHRIVTPDIYTEEIRKSLHPYVVEMLDLAIPLVGGE